MFFGIVSDSSKYLIVAGGGGGGNGSSSGYESGGGGAGGLLSGSITLSQLSSYTITVGGGGGSASTGSNSSAFGLTAFGGGAGATSPGAGGSGGSGGGGSHAQTAGGAGTAGQGNAGATPSSNSRGGGGGGAGAVGTMSGGGNGLLSSITGTATYYAGGGAGVNPAAATSGGLGGGGGSSATLNTNGTAGTLNTGGGGGGAYGSTSGIVGGAGGSGVVIVSYAGSPVFMGGSIASSGGNTIHTFTSSGILTAGSFIAGLFKTTYAGYFADNVSFFASATPTTYGANPATSVQTTIIQEPSSDDGSTFSVQWLGYFFATTTETYTFYTNSDDASYCWVGNNALSGFTTSNAIVNNGGAHGDQERSGTINLVANTYYPIRIQFGEDGGGDVLGFNFSTPTITKTTNVTNRVFYNSATNGH